MDPSDKLLYQLAVLIPGEEQSEQDIAIPWPDQPSDESLYEAKWLWKKCLNHYFNCHDNDILQELQEEKLAFIITNTLICFPTMRHLSSLINVRNPYIINLT